MRRHEGFSLIELAIVLVGVGFLLGAILQGQSLLYNARLQRISSDMREYAQSFLLYYERYGMYPGDENDPAFPPGDTREGNHDGFLTSAEASNAWEDLATALGVVRKGSPVRGGSYQFGSGDFEVGKANYISVDKLPNRMAQAIDARQDDGVWNKGNIRSSAAYDGTDQLVELIWRM